MCLPAARMSDMHTCPAKTGPVEHFGGPILQGFVTVLIGNLPAARAGDLALCVGSLDMIQTGSSTVLIGNKPAARQKDKSFHKGEIATGCPTVLIGGQTTAVEVPEDIPRPDKKYRIRILRAEAAAVEVIPVLPFVKAGFTYAKIYIQIEDLETGRQAKFTLDWFGPSASLGPPGPEGEPDRPSDQPHELPEIERAAGKWKYFSGPDLPLQDFAGKVHLRPVPPPPFGYDLDLRFLDEDSQAMGDEGLIKGIDEGADFDPGAYPDAFTGLNELEYEEGSEGPSEEE